MSKFSKRERILIFVMIIVAIVIGSLVFLIVPKYKELGKLQSSLDTLKMEKQTLMSDLYLMPTYENTLKQSEEKIAEISSKLFSKMSNDEIDKLMSTMITVKGLDLRKLQIDDVIDVLEESEEVATSDEDDMGEEYKQGQDTQTVTQAVQKKSVYIELTGEIGNINALVDEITKNKKLVLLSFSSKPNKTNVNATLIIQFNMVNK